MTKIVIQIDSPETISQLNSELQEVGNNPSIALHKIIRYLRGAIGGENNGISVQVTTRDSDAAASNINLVKIALENSTEASDLITVTGSGITGLITQAKTNLSGGIDGVAASFSDEINVEGGGTDTLTVVCDDTGVAGNKNITGDGTSDLSTLIGAGYTISAGGTLVLKSGDIVHIAGGVNAIAASKVIQGLTLTAKTAGVAGNSISVTISSGASIGSEVVTVVSNDITIQIQDTVSLNGTGSQQNTHIV